MAIKSTPDDFRVEEILTDAVRGEISPSPLPFALYRLRKRGLSTPQATTAVAKALRVPPPAVAAAGMKDKHAVTAQFITVRAADAPQEAQGEGWRIERIGWLGHELTAAAIQANKFEIIVRGLRGQAAGQSPCELMDQRAAALRMDSGTAGGGPMRLRLVNYFGDQRFGSARAGRQFPARHLIRGQFEEALKLALAVTDRKESLRVKQFKRAVAQGWGKWREILPQLPRCPQRRAAEVLAGGGDFRAAFAALPYLYQQLCVEAYQSWLWNRAVNLLVSRSFAAEQVFAAKDPFGELSFPAAAAVPPELVGLEIPLLGLHSPLVEPWKPFAEEVLAAEGVATAELRIPGLRRPAFGEAPRPVFVEAGDFAMSAPQAEDSPGQPRFRRTLSFTLPRGAYATVLLRSLGQ